MIQDLLQQNATLVKKNQYKDDLIDSLESEIKLKELNKEKSRWLLAALLGNDHETCWLSKI